MTAAVVGVIMLDTVFPRPAGDIGHVDSFAYPVIYHRVDGASANQAVRGDADALLPPFLEAGYQLVADGAKVIGTSCGFLSLFQAELEAALHVPVVASALSLVPKFREAVGIVTIDATSLSLRHLRAAGITARVPIVGLPEDSELATVIFKDLPELDMEAARFEMVAAAQKLVANFPEIEVIVFECTNMGPYRDAVSQAVGLPVFTIVDAIEARMPS